MWKAGKSLKIKNDQLEKNNKDIWIKQSADTIPVIWSMTLDIREY